MAKIIVCFCSGLPRSPQTMARSVSCPRDTRSPIFSVIFSKRSMEIPFRVPFSPVIIRVILFCIEGQGIQGFRPQGHPVQASL